MCHVRTRARSCGLSRASAVPCRPPSHHVSRTAGAGAARRRPPTRNMPGQLCDPRHLNRAIEDTCSTTPTPFDHPTRVRSGGGRSVKTLPVTGTCDVTCSCVIERNRLSSALLAGGCAARGVRVRAHRSLATGVGDSFCHRRSPRLARARPADGARCTVLDPCGATRGNDTRLGGQRGAMRLGGVPQRARRMSIARAPKLRRYPGEGSAVTPGRVDAVP